MYLTNLIIKINRIKSSIIQIHVIYLNFFLQYANTSAIRHARTRYVILFIYSSFIRVFFSIVVFGFFGVTNTR